VKVISGIEFNSRTISYKWVSPDKVAIGEVGQKSLLFYYEKNQVSEAECV